MPNRYTRDELIKIALNVVDLPNLEVHDAPEGVVLENAFCIEWLQEIIDFWHHMVPFSATVAKASLDCTANSDTVILPEDFIVDIRNGYMVQEKPGDVKSFKRIRWMPLQPFINAQIMNQKYTNVARPTAYCIVGDDNDPMSQRQTMLVTPTPSINTVGQLWYYRLPPLLQGHQRPKVPNDYVCVEYLRVRALEWARIYDPGTAHKFCEKVVAGMKAAGLLNNPEHDSIPMDESVFIGRGASSFQLQPYAWMGQQ